MVLASTNVLVVEQAPPNGYHQCLCSQGKLHLPPASLEGSPKSAGGSDPGSFQITASVLGLGAAEILCAPFKSGGSISYSPLALPKLSSTGLQSQCSEASSSWCRTLRLENPMWVSEPSLLGENLCNCNYPPVLGSPTQSMDLDSTASPPLLPILLWFLLYIFSCRRSFLLVVQSFSLIAAL